MTTLTNSIDSSQTIYSARSTQTASTLRLEDLKRRIAQRDFTYTRMDQGHEQAPASHLPADVIAAYSATSGTAVGDAQWSRKEPETAAEAIIAPAMATEQVAPVTRLDKDPFGSHLKPQRVAQAVSTGSTGDAASVTATASPAVFRSAVELEPPVSYATVPAAHVPFATREERKTSSGESRTPALTDLLRRAFPAQPTTGRGGANEIEVREIEIEHWPEMVEKMLTLGRATVQQLSQAVRQQGQGQQRLIETVIAGASRGSGATTIALTLARQLAAEGERVLMIDADIQAVGMTRALSLYENRSWVTITRDMNFIEKGMVRDANTGIFFAALQPLRLRTVWPPFIFDHLAALLGTVQEKFDRVLIDVGTPQQLISELSGHRSLASSALIITRGNDADEEAALRIRTNLVGVGIEHVIFAQNFARKPVNVQ